MNGYFEYLLSRDIDKNENLIKPYFSYNTEIQKYKEIFDMSDTGVSNKKILLMSGFYTLTFDLFGGSSYEINIDIDMLKYIISQKKLDDNINYNELFKMELDNAKDDFIRVPLNKEFLRMIVDPDAEGVEYEMKNSIDIDEPIICGDFKGINNKKIPFIILDGNHRAYAKLKSGKDNIDSILVSRNIWMSALSTEQNVNFVKILNNVSLILSYRKGNCSYEVLEKYKYKI